MSKESGSSQSISFGSAVGQLEKILERIEGEEIDIDELADQLKKAAGLLELCRGKIRKAETEVQQVVDSLAEEADAEPLAPETEDN